MQSIWIRQMLYAGILRLLSAIRYEFFILQLFNNRQASLNNLSNFRHLTFAGSIYSTYFTLACLSIDHYGQALIFDELS